MAINQTKPELSGQFEYLGRWIDKKNFRAFVYGNKESVLANSYEEYQKLISSGLWFPTKKESETLKPEEIEQAVVYAEQNIADFSKRYKKFSKSKNAAE